ncbi:MAG: glutamate--tRNA ligase family protein [Mucilaginibacter sp.]
MSDTGLQHFNKTRIAPTPSGYLHLGNVLSFSINAAVAKKTRAKILLRIDDLDRARVNKAYVQDIFDTLNFLEIPWDEGPRNFAEYESEYSQLYRMELYEKALDELKHSGAVFACTCSRSEMRLHTQDDVYPGTCRNKNLPLDIKDASWRLKTAGARDISVKSLTGMIHAELPAQMQDFVVRKKDGYPAYQLTSVVDDLYFGVDLIVRGEDLWPSTLAQLYLSSVLHYDSFQKNTFFHHALLSEHGGKKLSKSAGDTSIKYLREQGKKPEDIYRAIGSLLGIKGQITNWQKLYIQLF